MSIARSGTASTHEAWRSPPPQETPLVETSSLPGMLSPKPVSSNSPAMSNGHAHGVNKNDLLHPSFLPPCEHSKDDGDMHAHAFDLLSLSGGKQTQTATARPPMPASKSTTTAHPHVSAVPSSVPATSYLSASRPPTTNGNGTAYANGNSTNGNGEKKETQPKARRMSSSTTGVLGRGKLGLTGEGGLGLGGLSKDNRTSSYTAAPVLGRRPTISGSSPTPQLFDFAKTDRRPSVAASASRAATAVPASLPVRSTLQARAAAAQSQVDDIELDMQFDGDDDEEGEGSGRSGSADIDMDMDMDEEDGEGGKDWEKLALGTGSGGVKGRRKGMVFKCETCKKEYRHPSCLVKHRWEHSPHWKEPTALSMSKHQQVQMLEAAAILAHLDPNANGRSLPNDKSLWPAILGGENNARGKSSPRSVRDPSLLRSPPSSVIQPLTPSSLREPLSLGSVAEHHLKERKSSPGSDSTTSSMGASEPYIPQNPNGGLGLKNGGNAARSPRPMGINPPPATARRHSSFSSMHGTPHSVGSLPDMAGLNFHSGTTPTSHGMSPIPNRAMPLYHKAGMVGGGMFGAVHTAVPSSSVRSGAADLPEEDGEDVDEEEDGWGRRGKGSSEEADGRRGEGEEWAGMASEMEL
ncbi:hypothetical protein IAU60_006464 [Kwoniella sp. DSM 27419]